MHNSVIPPVIGVDLGASFTKVSYRPAWKTGDHYERPSEMVVIEGSPLVPSIVIYSVQNGRWLLGADAAGYRPTPDDRVFSNWKAALYSQRLDHRVDGAMDAASKFFEWLGQQLRSTGIPVGESKIKICLPAFDGAAEPGRMLVGRMKRCGWAGLEHSTIEEPRANTIGMFSEGKNAARSTGGEILPVYMSNFPMGSAVLTHLRNHALNNGPRFVSFLIIDIGSFTADLSLATLDAQRDGDCIQQAVQHSFEMGLVDHYEKPLFDALYRIKGIQSDDLNFNDRERIKNAVNSDSEISVATPGRGSVVFSKNEDLAAGRALTEDFARRLGLVVQHFMSGRTVQKVILTGGGAAISSLRKTLVQRLESQGMKVLPSNGLGNVETPIENEVAATISWEKTGETLERLATALGASSILMDLQVHQPDPEESAVPVAESPWIVCSCNGANKNCSKCDGVGMFVRNGDS